ncbi:Gfo/Idh/MocA family oxidoreductase [Acidobacteria bacterium AH-259-A15]|nr:Gfo/Idh/MocA family oxidoreductase [Acidobacteria bacterium AH-259-A15]
MEVGIDRRAFLKKGVTLGVGASLTGRISKAWAPPRDETASGLFAAPALERVRVGFVGVGGQGTSHLRNLLKLENVELRAVCDIVESKVARAQEMAKQAGQPKPEGYSRSDTDFKRLCDRDDLDLVYTATPWRWHVPICVDAMEKGKHAATEIPAAVTIDECWQLVETAERTNRHCVGMENCNYDRVEMMILNMVRKGLLGELLHAECGYLHDLRRVKFSDRGEGLWRIAHSVNRNGNLYPTHGLGPVGQCMNINRGDRFDYLVSMSSASRGLNLYAAQKFGLDDPRATQTYALGDVNTSLIMTKMGRTIVVKHDCNLPRPYSRDILVQGTKGIVRKYPAPLIYLEDTGQGNEGRWRRHRWEPLENYRKEYDHPLWVSGGDFAQGAGHGGMDYLEDYRLIECLLRGEPMDQDVYDGAALSAVSELSELSVANRAKSVDFPDFTRGKWKTRPPLGIIGG